MNLAPCLQPIIARRVVGDSIPGEKLKKENKTLLIYHRAPGYSQSYPEVMKGSTRNLQKF